MRRAKSSIRSILTFWFLAVTIVPLTFLSGYSTALYEHSLNAELQKRLEGNIREVALNLAEAQKSLAVSGRIHASDPTLVYQLGTRNIPASRHVVTEWMKTYSVARMVLFDREGRLVVAEAKGPNNEVKPESNLETGDVFLSDDLMKEITDKGQTVVHELRAKKGLEIIVYTRVVQKGNKTAGFLEETLELSTAFVQGIKKRLNLEAVIFNDKDMPVASSRDDFFLYPKDYFPGKLGDGTRTFFEFTSREEAFGMLASRLVDSQGHPFMTLGLAASKKDSQVVLHRITNTLLTVTALILLFLIPTLIYVSNRVVEPINLLVEATQRMEKGETASKLPIKSDTEIGILVDSFNKMAENIKTSQSSLIHSAKMASLGQLVAGVAHELNNPIGFIYSNMVHLRDYVNKLLKVLDVAENKPQDLAKIKEEVEYSYVVEDLNKLIASCEDGARRTRDIVLGLRNFPALC